MISIQIRIKSDICENPMHVTQRAEAAECAACVHSRVRVFLADHNIPPDILAYSSEKHAFETNKNTIVTQLAPKNLVQRTSTNQ
jgi:hypothetical protein